MYVHIRAAVAPQYRDWLQPVREATKPAHRPINGCLECGRAWLGFGNSAGKTCKQCRRPRKARNQKNAAARLKRADPEHVKAKVRKRMREWRARNPEKTKFRYDPEIGRANSLRINFGISIAQYEEMLAAQAGICGICGNADRSGRRLAVDHCHTTGKIRGLLCGVCNTGIGKLGDTIDRLERALAYLKRNTTQLNNTP